MFWDKLEKSNYFLNSIIDTAQESWDSRLIMHLLHNPIQDGGQWDMWVNLIKNMVWSQNQKCLKHISRVNQ